MFSSSGKKASAFYYQSFLETTSESAVFSGALKIHLFPHKNAVFMLGPS